MRTGIATFTLDHGQCPPWLFQRMVKLGREMTRVLVAEYGPDEFIKRIADPVWFQSLGTVLAFDWNASGLTTILTAALKESIREEEEDLGVFICGGKGKTSRKTPDQIADWGEKLNLNPKQTDTLVYSSKMAAKVDSSLVQDDYQLYHHAFFFSRNGAWAVVQQGMNQVKQTARRYHWYNTINSGHSGLSRIDSGVANAPQNDNFSFVNEPHTAISAQALHPTVLNLVSKKSRNTREISTELAQASYNMLMKDIEIFRRHSSKLSRMISFRIKNQYSSSEASAESRSSFRQARTITDNEQLTLLELEPIEFHHHPVELEDFSKSKYLEKILQKVTFYKPEDYESFVAMEGVGPKTVRALSLVSEVIYGAKPSYEDPARYSFAHGGKDATPYPVDRQTYDRTIAIMQEAVRKTRLNPVDKDKALRRLSK